MIQLSNIGLKRDDWVLRNINLTIQQGELVGIIGPSGIGKTTLLKIIAGLLDASEGEVHFDGSKLIGPSEKLIPGYEDIQLVNQDFGLEPYHTVEQNVKEKVLNLHTTDRDALVEEFLSLVELTHLRERQAYLLSGGEQQRLAIARALACEPSILLLDEPFVHIDQRLRLKIINYLLALNEIRDTTVILVSHDGAEVMGFVENVIHVENKQIRRIATASDMFYQPEDKAQGLLMGLINEIELNGQRILFRPNAYEAGNELKLTYQQSIDTGLTVFNYFATERGEQVVLTSHRAMNELTGIKVIK